MWKAGLMAGLFIAGSAVGQTTSTATQGTAAAHKPVTHKAAGARTAATHRASTAAHHTAATHPVTDAAAAEGLAAIGTMPAVTGPASTMYTLRYVDLQTGTGAAVKVPGYVTVKYTGWTTDGKKFDSSDDHPGQEPITFLVGVRRVIAGWDTGFEGMRIGGKRRLIIPWQLAYGEEGRPPVIPPKADLIFDIELLGESDTPPSPFAHPAAPATKTPPPSGSNTTTEPGSGTNPASASPQKPQQ